MLQIIDLYVTDEWFITNKAIVYSIQSYGLHRLKIVF